MNDFVALSKEVLTAEQFFARSRLALPLTGAQRLMLAMVTDAVQCFLKYHDARSPKKQRLFHEAKEWIWSSEQHQLFSFEYVCEHLRLDPAYLRQGLRQWEEQKSGKHRPRGVGGHTAEV